MSTQLLIYETAVPVSSGRHGKSSVEVTDYNFTRNVNAVPLVAAEFPEACAEYAIVFAGEGDNLMPVVILGARQNENLYLTEDGGWQVKYIPAFVRRYPFVFSSVKDSNTYTLCVDEAFQGLNFRGRGRALFTDEGKPTPFVQSVLNFLQEYTAQATRTQAFCKKLVELKILQPMQAEFTLTTGEKTALKGFMAVDRKKLRELSGDALAEMVKTDELELLYLHLQSLRNFMAVKDRLVRNQGSKAANGTVAEAPIEDAART
jgi:SapC protein